MGAMERYIPTEEERLLSLVGFVSADEILDAMGITTFRLDGVEGVVVKPKDSKLGFFDYSDCRPATKEETELHEQACRDYWMEEAAAGLI
jgi:hypothetical protein